MQKLLDFARAHRITVDFRPLSAIKGITLEYESEYYVCISSLITYEEQCEVLLHELGHCMTNSVYSLSDDKERITAEESACKWAAEHAHFADML